MLIDSRLHRIMGIGSPPVSYLLVCLLRQYAIWNDHVKILLQV